MNNELLYIEDVVAIFDEYLNETVEVSINGFKLRAGEVLSTFSMKEYLRQLDVYINEHFDATEGHDGLTYYTTKRNGWKGVL